MKNGPTFVKKHVVADASFGRYGGKTVSARRGTPFSDGHPEPQERSIFVIFCMVVYTSTVDHLVQCGIFSLIIREDMAKSNHPHFR